MNMDKKPNIVFITLDECKASALSCYGNKDAYTPNMDRFSEQSVLFTNAFATFPKCVPSRCAMMTGRYPHVEGHRTLPGFMIRKDENNLMSELKKHGYKTALFGKNHVVEEDNLHNCFDIYSYPQEGKNHGRRQMTKKDNPILFKGYYREGDIVGEELKDTYNTKNACDFIVQNKENPFFLYVDIQVPHTDYVNIKPYIDIIRSRYVKLPVFEELEQAPEVLKRYRETFGLEMMGEDQWRKIVEAYYSMVSFADGCVGNILSTISDEGLDKNTLVIITSDHGDFAGEHGCVEKWDTMFYDCLIKVPLMIRYPGRIKEGLKLDVLTDNVDLMPTILELCRIQIPPWIQGKSLVAAIDGNNTIHKEEVFCEGGVEKAAIDRALHYTDSHYKIKAGVYFKQKTMVDHPQTMVRSKMIRNKNWKLVFRVDGTKELYDMENDPMELCNVADKEENQTIIHDLIEKLLIWAINTETDYPQVQVMHA